MNKKFFTEEKREFHLCINFAIMFYFWEILDKDFGKKIDKESIHEIFDLLLPELQLKQSINILNKIDPTKLNKIKKSYMQIFK